MKDLKILLADDHPILLKGLISFLTEKGFCNLLSAKDGNEAWEIIQSDLPDICILDIQMPGFTGLEILERVRNKKMEIKVILLSYHNEPEFIALARKNGVKGFLGKENSIKEIQDCIHQVSLGEFYFPPQPFTGYYSTAKEVIRDLNAITFQERKVLNLISEGSSNRMIALELDISVRTVEKHRSNIIRKLKINEKPGNLAQWTVRNKSLLNDVL